MAKELEMKKQLLQKLDDLTSQYNKEQFYVKKQIHYGDNKIFYEREVNAHKILDPLGITPRLVAHDFIPNGDWFGSYFVTERHGVSLFDKYFASNKDVDCEDWFYDGPGYPSNENSRWFDYFFPVEIMPRNIRKQIRRIIDTLHENGIIHEDIHAGNFLVDDSGNVKVIDFEFILPMNENDW